MDQKEHIEGLIKSSKKMSKKEEEIQRLYEQYLCKPSMQLYEKLYVLVDDSCSPWVKKRLKRVGCYDEQNLHHVLQESRATVWKKLVEDCENQIVREKYVGYVFGIYRNMTRRLIDEIYEEREDVGYVVSLDEPVGEDKRTRGEKESVKDNTNLLEEKTMYDNIFQKYCYALLNYNTFLPRNLALYYARILPHLLHFYHEEKTIPETKKTSAKWAIKKMADHNVWYLTNDSEKLLREKVAAHLRWGSECRNQLNEYVVIKEQKILLKELIYTSVYDKGQVEDWADYLHKKVAVNSIKLVSEDRELQELVRSYVSKSDGLYRFAEGGKRK